MSITLLHATIASHCRLAAAGRKKLVLYRWRAASGVGATTDGAAPLFDSEAAAFEPLADVALPEPIRWMGWGDESQLWLALRGRYARLQVATLEMSDVLPIAASKHATEPLGAPLEAGEALLL